MVNEINLSKCVISENDYPFIIAEIGNNHNGSIKNAKKLGNKTENGKKMFIYQAAAAFKIWHGIKPEIDDKINDLLDE